MSAPFSVAGLIDESLALERAADWGAALQRARQALDLARDLGDPQAVAVSLVAVARFRFRLGQYDTARSLAREALALAAVDAPARADALLMLGMCAAETDALVEAEDFYLRAAELAREIGHHLLHFRALLNLALGFYLQRGSFDLALTAAEAASRIALERGLRDWAHFPLICIAWVCQITGQRPRAHASLEELDRLLDVPSIAYAYHPLLSAHLALDEGDLEAAPPLYADVRLAAEKIGEPGLNVEVRLGMSRYHRLAGDAPAALAWAEDALTVATRIGYRVLEGKAQIARARALWLIGDDAAAEADLRAAGETLARLGADFDLACARLLLAAVLHERRDPGAAPAWRVAVRSIVDGGYAFLLEQDRSLAFPLVAAHLNDPDPETAALSAALLVQLKRVPPPPLRIFTMGRFEVRRGMQTIPDLAWRHRRAGELFRLLLISAGRSLTREQVIEALWPERPPGVANTSFHQTTSALRHAIEPDLPDKFPSRYLEVEGGRVALHLPSGSWVDWEAFEQHVGKGQWEIAVALYGGELFPDDRYADWAVALRERLAQRFIEASLALAREALVTGHPQATLEAVRRALEVEPWQENAVLLGMQACLALDDRAGALRMYRKLERSLRRDLGIAPQAQVQEFYQSLCRV